MGFEAMTSGNPSLPNELICSSRERKEKRLLTTEEFDRILQTEPQARLSLVSSRGDSSSKYPSEKVPVNQHPSRKPLKKQISFDNFSHKLQHTSASRPPRTSLPHYSSYAHLSTAYTTETLITSGGHSHLGSDTETSSDTSSTSTTLLTTEKKSIGSLIKKTFGKKSKRNSEKDVTTSLKQSLPSSPSASHFSISPQPSPVDSIFKHSKTTLDAFRELHPKRYQSNHDEVQVKDWTDGRLPPTPQLNTLSKSHSTSVLTFVRPGSIASTPFQLAPAPKSSISQKSRSSTHLPEIPSESQHVHPPESPESAKMAFKSSEEVAHRSVEDSSEVLMSDSRSRSSFSSDDSFHTVEEASMYLPISPSQSRLYIIRESNDLRDASQPDLESLKWENINLSKQLEKVKRQLALEQSARSSLLKSMENARSQFDDISSQAYRKLRQVISENRRLHGQVKTLEGKLNSFNAQ